MRKTAEKTEGQDARCEVTRADTAITARRRLNAFRLSHNEPEEWAFCVDILKDEPLTSPRRLAENIEEKFGAKISYGTYHKWRLKLEAGEDYPEEWAKRRVQYLENQKAIRQGRKRR